MPSCLITTPETHWACLVSPLCCIHPSPPPGLQRLNAGFPFPSPDRHRSGFLLRSQQCFRYITSSTVCFSLLHLLLPPHGCRLFLALLSLKQAASWYSHTGGRALGAVLGYSFEFPLLTASLLRLPKRELSRQVFSCQLASILRSILYFCR